MELEELNNKAEDPPKPVLVKPEAVVAIDFGTARSGYAFSFNDPTDIKTNEFDYQGCTDKTLTALMISGKPGKYNIVAFGNEVNDKLFDNIDSTEMHIFKYFKMNLFAQQSVIESITASKARLPIVDIFAWSIESLVSSAMEHMERITTDKKVIFPQNIQWVITVPAIWNNAMKQCMRTAAERAGLPKNLILALEPEAAALCCRHNRKDLKYLPGTKYMLVDCGGGTVDIVFHEIDAEGNTLELRAPTGGSWGSRAVDKNFQQFMEEIFGSEQLKNKEELYVRVLAKFEEEKTKFAPKQKRLTNIYVEELHPPPEFIHKYKINNPKAADLEFKKRSIIIPNVLMAFFFEEPISKIIDCMEEAIASLSTPLNYIFLVGGFSVNNMLHDRISMRFQNDITKVVRPERSHMAVVEGAVHFGLNPNIILSRFSAYSYGIRVVRHFMPGDPISNMVIIGGTLFCRNIFKSFVKVNERVKEDHKVEELFAPAERGQEFATVPIFATKDLNLKYISEDMQEMGQLKIKLPKNEEPTERNIKVTMLFGGTEIKVMAEHVVTKERLSCSIDFAFVSGLPDIKKLQI